MNLKMTHAQIDKPHEHVKIQSVPIQQFYELHCNSLKINSSIYCGVSQRIHLFVLWLYGKTIQ